MYTQRHTIHAQGGRSSKYCDVDEHHPTANPQIMSPLNPGPNLANMSPFKDYTYSEESSVYNQGRLANKPREVDSCREQYAPTDLHDRPQLPIHPSCPNAKMSHTQRMLMLIET